MFCLTAFFCSDFSCPRYCHDEALRSEMMDTSFPWLSFSAVVSKKPCFPCLSHD